MPKGVPKVSKKSVVAGSPKDQIDQLINETNKRLAQAGSQGKVYRGADIRYVECERLPSGSLGLDVIMGGGLPRSRLIEYYGEESAGKTTMAARAVAANQTMNPKANFLVGAVEGFDKEWWRKNDVYIPFSEEELEYSQEHDAERVDGMIEYNNYASDYGDFVVQQIFAGDKLLEEVIRYVKSNLFTIAVIDSFGAIRPSSSVDEDDEKYREVGDDEFGGNAKMFGRFCGKLDAAFNKKVITADNPEGVSNNTCVIGINQVRSKIGGWSPAGGAPPEPTGGFSLKHTKSVSIQFSKGPLLKSAGTEEIIYGRLVRARCMKNKTARPHRDCEFPMHFQEFDGVFGVDKATEVAQLGVYTGLIEQSGAWYAIGGEQVAQGMTKLVKFIRENPELITEMTPEILRLSK